jgi:hypothetical protein
MKSRHTLSIERNYPKYADYFRLTEGNERFAFPKDADVLQDFVDKYGIASDLMKIYSSEKFPIVNKWHHYIPIYERYFEKYRGQRVRFLEIGVSEGGSLRMWREFFGPDAVIFGIDINQNCSELNGIHGQVRIGSQDDSSFLTAVVSEMGGVDVVLDDGSHDMAHIAASLRILFPQLKVGGTYLIEDLHTAYWRGFGGGYNSKDNFYRIVPSLIDDIHSWYHPYARRSALANDGVSSIHLHDSIIVLEKEKNYPPTHSEVGLKE